MIFYRVKVLIEFPIEYLDDENIEKLQIER